MGDGSPRPLVFDAGGLIAVDRGDRRILRLLELSDQIHIPVAALAQVWRDPGRQARLAKMIRAPEVKLQEMTAQMARSIGVLCAESGASDVVDASVVLVTRAVAGLAVTSDAGDLREIDPNLQVISC